MPGRAAAPPRGPGRQSPPRRSRGPAAARRRRRSWRRWSIVRSSPTRPATRPTCSTRTGPGGRPRRRHRQAGRGLRRHPGAFGIERDDTLKLRDFPTLDHVIGLVRDEDRRRRDAGSTPAPPRPSRTPRPDSGRTRRLPPPVAGDLAAADRLPRRVPVPVAAARARPVQADRGDPRRTTRGRRDARRGRRRRGARQAAGASSARPRSTLEPGTPTETLAGAARRLARRRARCTGVYWLAALDDEGAAAASTSRGWREALRRRVKNLYADDAPPLVRATRRSWSPRPGSAASTATTTRARRRPLGGAVTGFTKAYKRERPDALVKAVDFPREPEDRGARRRC